MKIPNSQFSMEKPNAARSQTHGCPTLCTRKSKIKNRKSSRAFSLVEVLAAIAIIGIITFLAIPNLLRIKEDGEKNLAISRAETLNMAMASFLQAGGQANATADWNSAGNNASRYAKLTGYVAFAPTSLSSYLPSGYSVTLPTALTPLTKATLTGPTGSIPY